MRLLRHLYLTMSLFLPVLASLTNSGAFELDEYDELLEEMPNGDDIYYPIMQVKMDNEIQEEQETFSNQQEIVREGVHGKKINRVFFLSLGVVLMLFLMAICALLYIIEKRISINLTLVEAIFGMSIILFAILFGAVMYESWFNK